MKRLTQIGALMVGFLFLLSGYAKSADASYFSYILERSGGFWLGMLSPVIILTEITLGLLLVFGIRRRLVAWLSLAMTVVLTVGFAYMNAHRGMFTCGCFGHLSALNLPLKGTVIRNSIVSLILLIVATKSPRENQSVASWRWVMIAVGLVIGAFATGLTFARSHVMNVHENNTTAYPVEGSHLANMIGNISPDSTYLVYVFATECDMCFNHMGNVLLYEREGKVDKIIGLAVADEDVKVDVPFSYTCFPLDTLLQLTDNIPTMMLIRNDSVVLTRRGGVLAPNLLGFQL